MADKKKRIAQITFWQSNDNYGQLLQCWALQQQLKKCGYEPFLIRYQLGCLSWFHRVRQLLKILLLYPLVRRWKNRKERALITISQQHDGERKFEEFRAKHLLMTPVYTTYKALCRFLPEADIYMVGSDQVWAPVLLDHSYGRPYWLDFGKKVVRGVSYAASFGTDNLSLSQSQKLARCLSRFDKVSVREESGIGICRKVGIEAEWVLDPTLLLTRTDYVPLMNGVSSMESEESYIFIYSLNITSSAEIEWDELKRFAKDKRWKVVVTPSGGYVPGRELFGAINYHYATIPQWLNRISFAKLVVTTSFHGVVFSILMHRNFVYFPLRGIHKSGNSRVLGLLSRLGLKEQVWEQVGDYDRIAGSSPDWDRVEKELSELRIYSIQFLEHLFG